MGRRPEAVSVHRTSDGYLPIEHYGAIGNLRSVALVGMDGSIDWCCLPEMDDPSVFGALLDAGKGGRFRIAPAGEHRVRQRYRHLSNVLETTFETDAGSVTVTDFMPLLGSIIGAGDPRTRPEIHRVVEGGAGEVEIALEWWPRFEYARAVPRIERSGEGFEAVAGEHRLTLGGLDPRAVRIEDDGSGPVLRARLRVREGERLAVVTCYGDGEPGMELEESLHALDVTEEAWREWSAAGNRPLEAPLSEERQELLRRSALALKLLTHPDTGAIAAAATTSLPEEIGGVRNWDYRYSWIRDSAFTVQALHTMGHKAEALDFLLWVHGICSEKADRPFGMQIMYGLHGEAHLPEIELDHLEGYRGSRPVRVGNGAAKQAQHDIYGELLGSAYELIRLGGALDEPMMEFLAHVADRACAAWTEPDYGIWEVRGGPRHFVYSKLMVWVALDRAIRLGERGDLRGDLERWRRNRDEVERAILERGWDDEVGAFVQAFGSKSLDAANLLIPIVDFLPFDDPRVQSTIDRTLERLTDGGLVHRYDGDDGLPGSEGTFGLTTFWMVDALALSGRVEEAREMFEAVVARANHVGLYAEEFDPRTGAFLGNFPQAFTHVGFINSVLYLARAEGRRIPAPAPIGTPEHVLEMEREAGGAG